MTQPMSATYTRQTLEETPARVLSLLSAIGTSKPIRTALATRGYTADEHAVGWALLHKATGYLALVPVPAEARAASDALAAVDAWDEPNFRLARATLERRYPEQAQFVFADLSAQTGPSALLSVGTFLDRLDALERKLPGRELKEKVADKAQEKADKAAIATLELRGITAAERSRLRGLIKVAQTGTAPDPGAEKAAAEAAAQAAERLKNLAELRAFYDEWAEIARIVITRRDYLIRLGLAKRKSGESEEPAEPEQPETPPAP